MFYFNGKVYVVRCIDDVDLFVLLEIGCCCWCYGNVVFLFLFYLIYGGCIIMDFINFMIVIGVI